MMPFFFLFLNGIVHYPFQVITLDRAVIYELPEFVYHRDQLSLSRSLEPIAVRTFLVLQSYVRDPKDLLAMRTASDRTKDPRFFLWHQRDMKLRVPLSRMPQIDLADDPDAHPLQPDEHGPFSVFVSFGSGALVIVTNDPPSSSQRNEFLGFSNCTMASTVPGRHVLPCHDGFNADANIARSAWFSGTSTMLQPLSLK
jgi:hypothetical protein